MTREPKLLVKPQRMTLGFQKHISHAEMSRLFYSCFQHCRADAETTMTVQYRHSPDLSAG